MRDDPHAAWRAVPDDAADRLNDAWNRRVRRQPPPDRPADPDLLATLDRLTAMAATPPPDPSFVARLTEDLMVDTTFAPTPLDRTRPWAGIRRPRGRRLAAPRPHQRRGAARPFVIGARLATAALVVLLAALIGQALLPGGGPPDPTPIPAANAPFFGSPAASPAALPPIRGDVAGPNNHELGTAIIGGAEFDTSAIGGPLQATLIKWTLKPGASIDLTKELVGTVPAIGIDFVLTGTAQTTVDSDFAYYRGFRVVSSLASYGKPGQPVEVERGDTLVYRYDAPRRIANPLAVNDLQVVTLILTAQGTTPPVVATAGFAALPLGEGELTLSADQVNPGLFVNLFVWSASPTDPTPELGEYSQYAIARAPVEPGTACCYYYNVVVDNAPRG